MKHFLILFFTTVCLSLSANVPNFDRTTILNMGCSQHLSPQNDAFANQLIFNENGAQGNTATIPAAIQMYNLTNLKQHLETSNQPTRSPSDALMKNKIVFFDIFYWNYSNDGNIYTTPYVPASSGGWTISMTESENDNIVYCYDLFNFNLSLYIDYSDYSVWMPTFVELGTIEYPGTDDLGCRNDTIMTIYMMNEDYFTQNANPANIHGTLYSDGSIVFDEGFLLYYHIIINHYDNDLLQSSDTTAATSLIYRNLSLIVPNAKHEFKYESTNYSSDAYTYQPDDTTLVVMNLWGLGNQGNVMYCSKGFKEDKNNMRHFTDSLNNSAFHQIKRIVFPFQPIIEINTDEYNNNYYTFDHYFYNFSGIYNSAEINDSYGYIFDKDISWGINTIADFYRSGAIMLKGSDPTNGRYPGLCFGEYSDNRLHLFDDEPNDDLTGDPVIEVADGMYTYSFFGIPSEEGTEVYLYTFDATTGELIDAVENPYNVPRTDEDQAIYLAAIADGSAIGKGFSNWVTKAFIVPALQPIIIIRGDVNDDGVVDLHDVVALNDFLLTGDVDLINYDNAAICDSTDGDDSEIVDARDLTALFRYILNEIWPDH